MHSLFDEHGASVSHFLMRLGVPRWDVDDAVQEVFLVVCRWMPRYEERGKVRSWLYSICARVAWKRRRQLRSRHEDLVAHSERGAAPTQLDDLVDQEALALGSQLLRELPPVQREVFWLYEVEELSMPEIARMVGCPLQTAYSRLHAARRRILAAVKQAANVSFSE